MPQPATATLTTTLSEVLAELAFLFVDDNEPEPIGASRWLKTSISYSGPSNGTLRMGCSEEFASLLATNLLGMEEGDDLPGGQANDAVKEFMNILCGRYITDVYGTQDVYNLSIPEISEADPTTSCSEAVTTISVGGHRVDVCIE